MPSSFCIIYKSGYPAHRGQDLAPKELFMVCKHFIIQELVSPAVFLRFGQNAWRFFDPRFLTVSDRLRDFFGPMIINDWPFGGNFRFRGLRSLIDLEAPKGDFSFHRFAMAGDAHFTLATVPEVRAYILAHPDKFPEIKGLEKDVNWLHYDTRNSDHLILF